MTPKKRKSDGNPVTGVLNSHEFKAYRYAKKAWHDRLYAAQKQQEVTT